jgi:choline dehydrogenase-like flavoprotein
MAEDQVDVLIIGAGASGAAMAWSLAETKMHIVCLEQGALMNPLAYPSMGNNWEARTQDDFATNPNVRGLPQDYPINEDNSPIKVANFNGVGGGTILYAGHFPRFHPSDFRVKSLDGVADDWPIDYNQLAPYYAENERITGVAGLAGDPAYPQDNAQRVPPLPLGKSGEVLAKGFNKLGWHWWPSDTAIITEEFDGRAPCINLGACGAGCAQGAKGSADVTYWPHALRAGVELRTRCRVREITVGEDGMATGAIYYDGDGKEQEIKAHVVIVACNGIGTPRMLLNSKSQQHPDGLANSSGLVGKNLMFHPYAWTQGIFDEPTDGHVGPFKAIRSQEFYETDSSRDFVRGYTLEIQRGMAPVRMAQTGMRTWAVSPGARAITTLTGGCKAMSPAWSPYARICRKSTIV